MNSVLIREVPKDERPRERLVRYGANNLSCEDLIAIILKTGTKDYSSKYLASKILQLVKNVPDLKNLTLNKLMSINGIGAVKAIDFLAALELGKRVYSNNIINDNIKFNNANVIYEYFDEILKDEKQECFYTLYLDQHKKLISKKMIFKGTLNKSLVHPREIFKEAYLQSAVYIICVHNHPSGNVTPSKEDVIVTKNLYNIGLLQGIPVIDHIIIGNNDYFSFYEEGYIRSFKNEKNK